MLLYFPSAYVEAGLLLSILQSTSHGTMLCSTAALPLLWLACRVSQATFVLQKDYFSPPSFFDSFTFWDGPDPTHGDVKYQGKDKTLISSTDADAQMLVSTAQNTPDGRPSIRITSKDSYEKGLFILDAEHMPTGCGVWPAYWLVGPSWPQNGEIG